MVIITRATGYSPWAPQLRARFDSGDSFSTEFFAEFFAASVSSFIAVK